MARYDDGKRGFGVTNALGLSEAWQQIREMQFAGSLQFPDREAPPLMTDFFRRSYPPDQWEDALRLQLQTEEAEQIVIAVIRSGKLPLWIAPVEGAITERQTAAGDLIEFSRESLIAGCYRPFNDTDNLVYGYSLFVKCPDWTNFISTLVAKDPPPDLEGQLPIKLRKRPGPKPDPDWSKAVAEVTPTCIAAGFKQPLKRGEKAAIQTMLLNFMENRNKFPSDDSARKYAGQVIKQLPDNSV